MTQERRKQLTARGIRIAEPVLTLEDRLARIGDTKEPLAPAWLIQWRMRNPIASQYKPVAIKVMA